MGRLGCLPRTPCAHSCTPSRTPGSSCTLGSGGLTGRASSLRDKAGLLQSLAMQAAHHRQAGTRGTRRGDGQAADCQSLTETTETDAGEREPSGEAPPPPAGCWAPCAGEPSLRRAPRLTRPSCLLAEPHMRAPCESSDLPRSHVRRVQTKVKPEYPVFNPIRSQSTVFPTREEQSHEWAAPS